MSQATTVLIQFDAIGDRERDEDIPDLPSDFKNTERMQEIVRRLFDQEFRPLTGWGGACAPQADDIYGACFNYFLVDEFMAELAKLDWAKPDRLRVFVQGEDDATFAVWGMETDGGMGAMVPIMEAEPS